ncbi:MAG: hypothetical protein JWQ42_4485 [Edaphobacter sp.]|nr:hypothetical protein [Edaphobacter sp.]
MMTDQRNQPRHLLAFDVSGQHLVHLLETRLRKTCHAQLQLLLDLFHLLGNVPHIVEAVSGFYSNSYSRLRLMEMDQVGANRKRWARKLGGWGLLIVGVAGCVLPVAPGIPFVLAGLVLLAKDYAWAKHALRRMKRWVIQVRRKARARKEARAMATQGRPEDEPQP